MTVLKQLNLLLEKHLSELYHATYPERVLKMLKDNAVKLLFQQGSDIMSKKSFYLSTMRVKYGNYADYYSGKGKTQSNTGFPKWETIPAEPGKRRVGGRTAVVNINGDAVGDIAQVKSVEYWGKTFTKGTGKKEEQEERIFSNKSELAPLAKYVNAIHLFLNDLENKFTRQVFIDIRKFNTVPIYIYDNPDYFMSQVKSKAMTDKQLDAALGTATDMTDDEKAQYNDTEHTRWGADSIKAMMQIYNGEKSDSEAYKRVFDLLTRYKYDALGSLDADIHNNKFKHLPIFIDLAKAMRKEKITNVADFIKLLMKKADEMREI